LKFKYEVKQIMRHSVGEDYDNAFKVVHGVLIEYFDEMILFAIQVAKLRLRSVVK